MRAGWCRLAPQWFHVITSQSVRVVRVTGDMCAKSIVCGSFGVRCVVALGLKGVESGSWMMIRCAMNVFPFMLPSYCMELLNP